MKIVQILRKVPPVNSEVLVDLNNIEIPERYNDTFFWLPFLKEKNLFFLIRSNFYKHMIRYIQI